MILDNLKHNAERLIGVSLGELAAQLNVPVKQQKGWIGQLIEKALHAQAGSKPIPDFPELGVELKTIPMDDSGRVKESTFVCTVNLEQLTGAVWDTSPVKLKLSHVLWVPIQSDPSIAFAERRIGVPVFWQPSESQMQQLKTDWQELTDQLQLGYAHTLNGLSGQVLQIRPKAANAQIVTHAYDEQGDPCVTLPRGFYLRATFTNEILAKSFAHSDNKS